jgi:hypothetical protein
VLLLNECLLLLLFTSLSTESGNFWLHPPMCIVSLLTCPIARSRKRFDFIVDYCTDSLQMLHISSGCFQVLFNIHWLEPRTCQNLFFLHMDVRSFVRGIFIFKYSLVWFVISRRNSDYGTSCLYLRHQNKHKLSKVKLSRCLTKHNAMKTYWGLSIAPRIL